MNKFFEKYEVALWMCVAAIWFFAGLIEKTDITTFAISGGCFWLVFAIIEFIRIKMKK